MAPVADLRAAAADTAVTGHEVRADTAVTGAFSGAPLAEVRSQEGFMRLGLSAVRFGACVCDTQCTSRRAPRTRATRSSTLLLLTMPAAATSKLRWSAPIAGPCLCALSLGQTRPA